MWHGSKRGIAVGTFCLLWLIGAVLTARVTPSESSSGVQHETAARRTALARANAAAIASAQAAAQAGSRSPQMADEIFKNVQVLKGLSVDDFMGTMGVMSAALSYCCGDCHTGAGTSAAKWDDDTPKKRTARRMVQMVADLNKQSFGGRQVVTCWTCHRGREIPVITPTIDSVYGTPIFDAPDIVTPVKGMALTADQVLDKYLQAIGGAQRLGSVKSFVAKAKSSGFGGFSASDSVEIFAQAPDKRATYIHLNDPKGTDSVRTYDGRAGWIATPLTVVQEYTLVGGELDGARLDAQLSFPAQIKTLLTDWRVGTPTTLEDRPVNVVQGNGPRGLVGTFYFDRDSGLLVRYVRFANGPIGRVPTQVDYSDYRDVGGIKVPFHWTFSWLSGQEMFEMGDIQFNAPVDPAKFARPAASAAAR